MREVRPFRLLFKALSIFIAINIAFALLDPPMGRLTLYNWMVKGRQRFPYGGSPSRLFSSNPNTYNLSVADLDAAFAAHVISNGPKAAHEFRIVLLGDSQTWGTVVGPRDTLTERLNKSRLSACGKQLKFYNLAYPVPSVLKDFVILDTALKYQPDLVVWMLSLNSLVVRQPPPLWGNNDYWAVADLLVRYQLDNYTKLVGSRPALLDKTPFGERQALAVLFRFQLDGLLWDATDIDSERRSYDVLSADVPADSTYSVPSLIPGEPAVEFEPPKLDQSRLQFDVLAAARRMLGVVPVLIVDEPIYIASGANSNIRYNTLYPRWAFDEYRDALRGFSAQQGWAFADLYDSISYREFSGSPSHINAEGERELARRLTPYILDGMCR